MDSFRKYLWLILVAPASFLFTLGEKIDARNRSDFFWRLEVRIGNSFVLSLLTALGTWAAIFGALWLAVVGIR